MVGTKLEKSFYLSNFIKMLFNGQKFIFQLKNLKN